jgi:hypothetical protein
LIGRAGSGFRRLRACSGVSGASEVKVF